MNNLSDIIRVEIDISQPASDNNSLDSLLIVGLPPVIAPLAPLPDVGVYFTLEGVAEAGFAPTDPVGEAALIAFSQNPKPAQIFIAVQKEAEELALEPIADTLSRALETPGWYVICPAGIGEEQFGQIAAWTEAQSKLFAYTFLKKVDPVGDIYYRSFGWCGLVHDSDLPGQVPAQNKYLHVAAVAKCLSYPSGSETWAFKQLSAVFPSFLSTAQKKALADGHSNYFAQYAGRNITMNGQVRAGEWIDVMRGVDWLKNDMQLRLFNLMLLSPRIDYTNSGIAQVQNEMIASLKSAQARGLVAEDEYDADGALIPGYSTSVPNSADVDATQKASRVLSGCTFKARPAGAIHVAEIRGNLTY